MNSIMWKVYFTVKITFINSLNKDKNNKLHVKLKIMTNENSNEYF